jgi:hypothetical protein
MIRLLDLPKKFWTDPKRAWAVRKAMVEYRKTHKICAWCGRPETLTNQVVPHHVVPFHVAPDIGDHEGNFIPLHHGGKCHIICGHAGDYKHWVANVQDVCAQRIVRE